MNLIFFGSDRFAVPALRRIHNSRHKILYVVTQPDRQAGRGLSLIPTPVKQASRELDLALHQSENVNAADSQEFLKNLQPDLFCVVAFGQILSSSILSIPKIFTVNLHASLLPKYRGAAPINWAIIRDEKQTGVSVIKMTQKMDAGPIILQKSVDIQDTDNALILEDRLSTIGADLLVEALDLIQTNKYNLIAQDEKVATLAPKLKKEDGLISWKKSARYIFNLIRGCAGWPGAFTYFQNKILKIHRVSLLEQPPEGAKDLAVSPGRVLEVSKKGIVVATSYGCLLIEELQIEGKKKISAQEFVSGYRISVGEILGAKNS